MVTPATTSPRRVRKGPSSYHHGDLRSALLHATVVLVGRHGVEGLTLKRVAGHVGVSSPAVYHHFRNKTDLIAAGAAFAFETLECDLARALERSDSDAASRLEALARAYVRFAVERRGAYRLSFGAHVSALGLSKLPAVARPGRAAKALFRAAVREAFPENSGQSCEQIFAIFWGQLVGIATLVAERELGPHVDLDEALELARLAVRSHLLGLPRRART
jgi:AcrR family transcriptional regulator